MGYVLSRVAVFDHDPPRTSLSISHPSPARRSITHRSFRIMPTVTVDGEKSFQVESGKKLVLAIEDAGIDICIAAAETAVHNVPGQILGGEVAEPEEMKSSAWHARKTSAQHSAVLPGSRQIRSLGRGRQYVLRFKDRTRARASGLTWFRARCRMPNDGGTPCVSEGRATRFSHFPVPRQVIVPREMSVLDTGLHRSWE